ncbi:hypothetical protein, partial [Leucobacter luti]|uniref:hypothetical protein n=1 Tax=Leucobacter luti TaxID=340320 RepID=UPI0018E56046
EYEVVVWPRRTNPVESNIVKVIPFDVSAEQWDAVFPKPGVSGSASVSAADASGVTVEASVSGVDPASQPAGVHVGVVLRGTAAGTTQAGFLGNTQSVTTIPASGEFSSSVTVPVAQLDRTKEYEVVVWPRRTNPVESNIVKVIPFDVSAEQWDAVFPKPEASAVSTVAGASETGLTVKTVLANVVAPKGAYVAVIEAGTVSELTGAGSGLAVGYIPAATIVDGAATNSLEVAAAKLDRTKKYEVVTWHAQTLPTAETIISLSALSVSSAQWDEVFPSAAASVKPKVSAASAAGLT